MESWTRVSPEGGRFGTDGIPLRFPNGDTDNCVPIVVAVAAVYVIHVAMCEGSHMLPSECAHTCACVAESSLCNPM